MSKFIKITDVKYAPVEYIINIDNITSICLEDIAQGKIHVYHEKEGHALQGEDAALLLRELGFEEEPPLLKTECSPNKENRRIAAVFFIRIVTANKRSCGQSA